MVAVMTLIPCTTARRVRTRLNAAALSVRLALVIAGFGMLTIAFQSTAVLAASGTLERIPRADGDVDMVERHANLPFVLYRRELRNTGSEVRVVRSIEFTRRIRASGPLSDYRSLSVDALRKGDQEASSYLSLSLARPDASDATVAGWVTQELGSGIVFLKPDGDAWALTARLDFGKLTVAPGKPVVSDAFALGTFDDARLGLESYAACIARENDIHLPSIVNGYCTWYSSPNGGAGSEKAMAELAEFSKRELTKFGFNTVLIDDQWQGPAIAKGGIMGTGPTGNYTRHDPKGPYPSGMKPTAAKLQQSGLRPGLWLTPFSWNPHDPLFKDHQDWFVKKADGSLYEVLWAGWCLDMTHPAARDFLTSAARRITGEWGFGYLKPDALWCGLAVRCTYPDPKFVEDQYGDAVFHDPTMSNMQAFRAGLRALRKGAGRGVYIGGCNIAQNFRSMGGAIGLVDAMRIGPDTGADWGSILPSVRLGSRLYYLHNRVWHNDPDCLMLREPLTLDQARSFASWVALSGQLNLVSEWLPGLPPERLDCFKRSIPNTGLAARAIDLFEQDPARVWHLNDARDPKAVRDVIGFFNWDDKKSTDVTMDSEQVGLKPSTNGLVGFDYWENKMVELPDGKIAVSLKPSGCRILSLRPALVRPQVVGTSRHICQGVTDLSHERWDAKSMTLSGRSLVVGGDPYELRVNCPSGWILEQARTDSGNAVQVRCADEGRLVRVGLEAVNSQPTAWYLKFKKISQAAKK